MDYLPYTTEVGAPSNSVSTTTTTAADVTAMVAAVRAAAKVSAQDNATKCPNIGAKKKKETRKLKPIKYKVTSKSKKVHRQKLAQKLTQRGLS